jgi:ribonuclease P protein component
MHDFPKSVRLLRPAEFRRVYDNGAKYTCPFFAAFSLKRENEATPAPARFGFTTPRALGKAVQRNRIRRRLRECVRLRKERFPAGLDVVFNPRRALLDAPWPEVESQVEKFILRLHK